MATSLLSVAFLTAAARCTNAFVAAPVTSPRAAIDQTLSLGGGAAAEQSARRPDRRAASATVLSMSSTPSSVDSALLSLSLEKPLGLILEEAEDGAGGVIVTQVNEGGSAHDSPYKEQLVQSKIGAVMGTDVSTLSFDDVMDAIVKFFKMKNKNIYVYISVYDFCNLYGAL